VDRSRLVALVVGAVLALLFVTVATAEPARIADRQPSLPWELPELEVQIPVPTTVAPEEPQPEQPGSEPSDGWDVFTTMLQIAVVAILALAVAHLLRRAWQNRPRLHWRRRAATADFDLLDDVADAVVADAAAQQAALRTGAPSNAIVECWLRLESVVEDAGIEHDPALTSAEFTAAVLAAFDVDPAATTRLAALYREARFSAHPMDESHRRAAIEALDAVHAGLRPSRPTAPSVGTP
jgi:Domain of unknown function (DUF4129)